MAHAIQYKLHCMALAMVGIPNMNHSTTKHIHKWLQNMEQSQPQPRDAAYNFLLSNISNKKPLYQIYDDMA